MQFIQAIVDNPVKVAVGVLLMVLFGTVALLRMPMQLTPEVQTPTISIQTFWPGASPQEVEREIVIEQEEQLKGVQEEWSSVACGHVGSSQLANQPRTTVPARSERRRRFRRADAHGLRCPR